MRIFILDGRNEAPFREIIRRYQETVYMQARRILTDHHDADEAAQNTFIKLWKHAGSFRFDSSLGSFIYRIAYNESISQLRKKRRSVSLEDPEVDGLSISPETSNDNFLLDTETIQNRLEQAIATLPEKQKLVFHYRYYDELPFAVISRITGTSEGALKASYHIAAEKIRKMLTED